MMLKVALRVGGIFLILTGLAYAWFGMFMGSEVQKMIAQGKEITGGGALLIMVIFGILVMIVGIGSIKLNKIAIYCSIPVCLLGVWVLRIGIARAMPIFMLIAIAYLAIIVCSILYSIKTFDNKNTIKK